MAALRSGLKTNPEDKAEYDKDKLKSGKSMEYDKRMQKMQLITFTSLVIDLLGFTVILPLFPTLLDYYSKHDPSGLFNLMQRIVANFQWFLNVPEEFNNVLFGGILGSLFSLLQFFSSPICGALSDFYGRKPIMLVSLIGVSLSYGLWFTASNFTIFVLARMVGGLSKGNVSLSYSIMTDIVEASSRSKGMALIGVAFSIGFIIGPVVGVGFSQWGTTGWFATSALYAMLLSLVNIAFFAYCFEETLPEAKRSKTLTAGIKEASDFISPVKLFKFSAVLDLKEKERVRLMQLGRIYFLYLFVYSGLEFTITFVTHHVHRFDSMAQGRMFAYLGVVMALVQGGFVRSIKEGKEKHTCFVGLIILIPAFISIGISNSKIVLYIGLTLYAIGSSLMVPCLTALASQLGPVSQKGTILGIWRSLGALARAVGPIIACLGFWMFGSGLAYMTGGFILLLPLLMLRNLV